MWRVVVKESYGSWRAVMGGVDVVLWASWVCEFEILSLPRVQTKQIKTAWVEGYAGCSQGHSFVEVLQSKPCSELKGWHLLCMDLLQVTTRSEMGNGRFAQQLAVDCFELENSLWAASS